MGFMNEWRGARLICVVDRDGAVVYEGKSASTADAIADKLSEAPSCHRIVFETGRMAPILFHGRSNSASRRLTCH